MSIDLANLRRIGHIMNMESTTTFYRDNDTLTIEVTCTVELDRDFTPADFEVTAFLVTDSEGEQFEYTDIAAKLHWYRMVTDDPSVLDALEEHHDLDADEFVNDYGNYDDFHQLRAEY